MAHDLFNETYPEIPDIQAVGRVSKMLPELLSTFALEIGHIAETQMHRDVMVFVHKNRSIFGTMSWDEKISRWNVQNEGLEDKYTLDDPSLKGQENDAVFQASADTPRTQVFDKESEDGEEESDIAVAPSYSDFIAKTPAYELLLTRLRRELLLIPSEPNHMEVIRRGILESLLYCNRVSRKTSAKAYTITFVTEWDPLAFFEEQMYQEEPQEVVEKVITLTGSVEDVQAQTCAEYLSQTWSSTGKLIILLVKNVIRSGPGHRHTCESVGGTKLTAWIQESRFMVEAFGTASSVAEVGEQLAWLGAALRSSPFESGVTYCTPSLCKISHPNRKPEAPIEPQPLYKIDYTIEKAKEQVETMNGQCWRHLFRNPVVVNGYPIPWRPQRNTGLEIPLRLMVALAQARHVTTFDGKLFIKGFCTMLIPTKHVGDMVIWHMLVNEDGSHISYVDPRVRSIPGMHLVNLRIFDEERSRHVIGWCPYVKSYAGAPGANYDIGWSGLDAPYQGNLLKKKTISSKKLVTRSESFVIGLKDIPDRNRGDPYLKRLRWIAGMFVLLFDVKESRAWLIDGASSLLHLVRASLRFSQLDEFRHHFLFKSENMEEASPTETGKDAAIAVLTSDINKKIKLYEPSECFEGRVEEILHILEQVATYQENAEREDDIPQQQLEGFDFNDVAKTEERIKPRMTELPAKGRGWADFTKAIHAMTLFGSGFGELLRPIKNKAICSFWDKVPVKENYLAVSVSDIKGIMEKEKSMKHGLPRLVDDIYWHKPAHIFEACACVGEDPKQHSDRVQVLLPRNLLGVRGRTLKGPGPLEPNGAVIFGHSSQFLSSLENFGNLREVQPSSTYQEANLDCYDSGLGSRLLADEDMEDRFNNEKFLTSARINPHKKKKTSLLTNHLSGSKSTTVKNHQFTIGWISPLPLEKEAARLVLDEEYPREEVRYQSAFYLGGRIGKHEVVIGVQRIIGLSGATSLAERMRAGFPNIKYFLLVGIAGGVPRYGPAGAVSEIVLGDVVVSYPRGNHGGVIQYDKGAWKDLGRLDFCGHTNGVNSDLLAAINNFRAEGWSKTNIADVLKQMRLKLDEERRHQYDDPGPTCDSLYEDAYEHQGTKFDDCKNCCNHNYIISRTKRGHGASRRLDAPFVHFGTIASSNQLQISAIQRKRLQQDHEVICFEMEAAGVMGEYPCVVIRGICDYADSHKNKGWQNYAAATAAAYARELLAMIPAIDTTDCA
ncbi:hypothetical protein GQ44DRAFT_696068 [Phaeosphaeriaceae sp. PMI808]|nr:hypothetical protein GQ44DRAFT_696068 [Phaeosphaeriaceae sp. PMI808]